MGRPKRVSNPTTKTFSERLSDLVNEKANSGHKQKEVAAAIGVGSGTLSEWCSDQKTPTIDALPKIAAYFDVSSDWLIGLSDVKSPDNSIQGACHTIGISESAVTNLQSAIADDPYEIINHLFEFSSFYDAISSIQKAIEVQESSLTRFSKELTAQIIELFSVVPGNPIESGFSNVQQHSDKEFDEAIRMLAELAPNMTVLSRKDAARHHLLTARDYLQKAMAEIVGDI